MYKQVERQKENKSRAVANSVAQRKSIGKQGIGGVDNQTEIIGQRKIPESISSCFVNGRLNAEVGREMKSALNKSASKNVKQLNAVVKHDFTGVNKPKMNRDITQRQISVDLEKGQDEQEEHKEQMTVFANAEKMANYLVGKGHIQFSQLDDVYEKLEAWDKVNKEFSSIDTLIKALFEKEEIEDWDGETEFFLDPSLWPESEFESNVILNERYIRGENIREGMDYKSTDKEAYSVAGDDELALIIREKRVKGAGDLIKEIETLKLLGEKIPTATVKEFGIYVMGEVGYPAMVMKRYVGSSKELVRQNKGMPYRIDEVDENIDKLLPTVESCNEATKSLNEILSWVKQENGLDDIQFLVDEEGKFVVNDVNDINKKYVETNVLVIQELLSVVKERKDDLEEE